MLLPMAKLITVLEQHLDRQPPTVVIQATPWRETLAHVKIMECGLAVNLHVNVESTPECTKNLGDDFTKRSFLTSTKEQLVLGLELCN